MTRSPLPARLRLSAWILIAFGGVMVLCALPGPDLVLNRLLDLVLPGPAAEHLQAPAARLLTVVSGGVIAGWGVLVLGLAGAPAQAAPEAIRRLVMRGYLAWFVIDSAGSVLVGAPLNVLGNAGFLALVLWPLMARPGADRPA